MSDSDGEEESLDWEATRHLVQLAAVLSPCFFKALRELDEPKQRRVATILIMVDDRMRRCFHPSPMLTASAEALREIESFLGEMLSWNFQMERDCPQLGLSVDVKWAEGHLNTAYLDRVRSYSGRVEEEASLIAFLLDTFVVASEAKGLPSLPCLENWVDLTLLSERECANVCLAVNVMTLRLIAASVRGHSSPLDKVYLDWFLRDILRCLSEDAV
jgi:hypothetical protein